MHRQHYLDLNRTPEREPSALAILVGAAVTCAALWAVALFLFTL